MTAGMELAKKQTFVVAYFDPPGLNQVPGDKEFADIRQGIMGSLAGKATLRKESPISLGQHPGREYELDAGNGVVSLVRLYLVGNRCYMLNATVAAADINSPEVQRFFNSFRLIR